MPEELLSSGKLAEAVGQLHAAGEQLEAFGHARQIGLRPRERGFVDRILAQQRRDGAAEMIVDALDENAAEQIRPALVGGKAQTLRAAVARQRVAVAALGIVGLGERHAGEPRERLIQRRPLECA